MVCTPPPTILGSIRMPVSAPRHACPHGARDLRCDIEDLIRNVCGVDSLAVYGCTNRMDVRLCSTIDYIARNNVEVSPDRWQRLASLIDAFADHAFDNGGKYFIPTSGTYTLNVQPDALRSIAATLRSTT